MDRDMRSVARKLLRCCILRQRSLSRSARRPRIFRLVHCHIARAIFHVASLREHKSCVQQMQGLQLWSLLGMIVVSARVATSRRCCRGSLVHSGRFTCRGACARVTLCFFVFVGSLSTARYSRPCGAVVAALTARRVQALTKLAPTPTCTRQSGVGS